MFRQWQEFMKNAIKHKAIDIGCKINFRQSDIHFGVGSKFWSVRILDKYEHNRKIFFKLRTGSAHDRSKEELPKIFDV